jgi:hypothetical protein
MTNGTGVRDEAELPRALAEGALDALALAHLAFEVRAARLEAARAQAMGGEQARATGKDGQGAGTTRSPPRRPYADLHRRPALVPHAVAVRSPYAEDVVPGRQFV